MNIEKNHKPDYSYVLKSTCILTPSKINNVTRLGYSLKSKISLDNSLGDMKLDHIIFHKNNKFKGRYLNNLIKTIYTCYGCDHVIDDSYGSAHALYNGIKHAISKGYKYAYIHLDDHIYNDKLNKLIYYSHQKMETDNNIKWFRYSGYPIIYDKFTKIKSIDNKIKFDSIELNKNEINSDITAWLSNINPENINGDYWPIALWHMLYRLDFLYDIFNYALFKSKLKHLAHVELFYKDLVNYRYIVEKNPDAKFGYINMEYAGFEFHRNSNWADLMVMCNDCIT